jgi:hypothetical protein
MLAGESEFEAVRGPTGNTEYGNTVTVFLPLVASGRRLFIPMAEIAKLFA